MSTFRIIILSLFLTAQFSIQAVETCSRVAIINYQEVLVDTNSTQKGEGLRYHIEKDKTAKSYLDKYQEGTKLSPVNTVLGTAGTVMMIGGILTNNNSERKQTLLLGGATAMIINFLIAKTFAMTNEDNLTRAIEEYNKRNLPKIYYRPDQNYERNLETDVSFMINKTWSF